MPEDRPRRTQNSSQKPKNSSSGWQLVAVQSISCVVVILIVLFFKMIGGSAFEQLRKSFNKSIMSNSLMATIAALLETPSGSSEADSSTSESTTATSETGTTQTGGSTESSTESTTQTSTTKTEAAQTSASSTAATTTAASKAASSAAGGNDIKVSGRKVLYAPASATFAPLKLNRIPNDPLQSGKITSYFGYRKSPINGEESFHQGLDIAAEMNSPIAAMYFGVVAEVGANQSYGNYVKIYHGNGIEVLYAHCSKILVNQDAVIRAGEIVAQVGSTGVSTGPHLHIEVRVNGVAYDPLGIIQRTNYA